MSSSSSSSSEQIFMSFFSKVGEQITDYTGQFMKNIKDFKLNVESLKTSLNLLNAKASDVKDQIKGSHERKRKREIEEWLARVKSIENEVVELGIQVESEGFIRNLMDSGKVAQLNEEVVMLVDQGQLFDEFLLHTCGSRGVEFLTTRMVGEAFADNVKRIWSLLETRPVPGIAIYGMGGVGKTALAKCIYNRLLKQSQARVFWVGVSQEFTVKTLQDKIASFVGLNLSDECDEKIRAARLYRALLQMKNTVIILDGLWRYIDLVKVGCHERVGVCRLIITTRSLEVCHQFGCNNVITMTTLCESEAWKLFIESLTSGEKIELGHREEKIAKSMVRLCGGLPLGIINVAESMRGKTSIHSWTVGLAELKEHVTGQGGIGDVEVFRVLKYSFDRLNNQSEEFNLFQLCFMYCSFYPQPGAVLDKDMLVERFISEGLVDGTMSRRAQFHQGRSILDKLVNVCLLETHDVRVKMHGLARGMALKIGVGKYMVKGGNHSLKEIPHEKEWTECLEKVCLMKSGIRIIRDGTSPNCPKLSTLLLQRNPLKAIPDSFFSKMKRLSTLNLCNTDITMLPEIVSDLTSLEALLLERCGNLEKVPYLGRLKALRELNLDYTAIKEVPEGVEELFNLKFLSIDAPDLKWLPRGFLLKVRHLQYVKFPVQVQLTAEEIENLKEVEHFSGRLKDVLAFNCLFKNQLLDAFYQVLVGQDSYDEDEVFGSYDRELYLCECSLKDEKVLGGEIQDLTITKCKGMSKCLMDEFSPSHYPKSLRILTIQSCKGIEYILTSSRESPSQFPALEVIDLYELEDFKGLIVKREIGAAAPTRAVFSALKKLDIVECNKMRKLGLPITGVPNIEEITISECGEIEEVFEAEGRGSVVLPKLKELKLEKLPRLKSLCEAPVICNSITTISIYGCPRLMKKMPVHLDVPLPPTLSGIGVEREWWKSLEWHNPSLPQLLKPFLLMFS